MVYFLLIFAFLLQWCQCKFTNGAVVSWHKVNIRSHLQPTSRFNSLTWVDDQQQLWLYGGQTIVKRNGSEYAKHLYDLWKFSLISHKWTKMTVQNHSTHPKFDKGLTSFYNGIAFVFGHQVHNKKLHPELWMFNISSRSWSLLQNNISKLDDCFAMWCNDNGVSFICRDNATVMQLRNINITSKIWKLRVFKNKIKFTNVCDGNVNSHSSVWNGFNSESVFIYIWPACSDPIVSRNSVLISASHENLTIIRVRLKNREYLSNRRGFIRWVDCHGNLHLLGGNFINSTSLSVHWVLNRSDNTWATLDSGNHMPSPRTGACFWHVDGSLWLFGGYMKERKGRLIVLDDFWTGTFQRSAVSWQPTHIEPSLPGDTLGLTMVNKLIISLVTLFVVLAVSVRLCYKRELNQALSRLQRNRVLYHELSQEGDKSTRL